MDQKTEPKETMIFVIDLHSEPWLQKIIFASMGMTLEDFKNKGIKTSLKVTPNFELTKIIFEIVLEEIPKVDESLVKTTEYLDHVLNNFVGGYRSAVKLEQNTSEDLVFVVDYRKMTWEERIEVLNRMDNKRQELIRNGISFEEKEERMLEGLMAGNPLRIVYTFVIKENTDG